MVGASGESNPGLDGGFYRDLVKHSADAIIAIDTDQKIVFVNPALEKMFGYSAEEMLGQDLNLLLPERFKKTHAGEVQDFVTSGDEARYMGKRLAQVIGRRADGSELPIGASIVRAKSGGRNLFAAILRDISWRIEMVEKLSEMARIDPLTGLLNRRSFLDVAADESARSERYGTGLACLFFDLDHFKALNDDFGHDAGDDVLRAFAGLGRNGLRTIDSLCRWGGEEFVALLPNTDVEGAIAAAERIRKTVEEQEFVLPGDRSTRITVSIGVAHGTGSGIDFSELIRLADAALYAAKKEGRNRVHLSTTEEKATS
ncbi:sensor domain-containing diguanylate cyclase [Nisaea sp.]|uniref:sensor domain-containing diguanylate cyclase n=1 Tax=Nisaea sp. TaxID=2024842 RepID=UPI003B523FCE